MGDKRAMGNALRAVVSRRTNEPARADIGSGAPREIAVALVRAACVTDEGVTIDFLDAETVAKLAKAAPVTESAMEGLLRK